MCDMQLWLAPSAGRTGCRPQGEAPADQQQQPPHNSSRGRQSGQEEGPAAQGTRQGLRSPCLQQVAPQRCRQPGSWLPGLLQARKLTPEPHVPASIALCKPLP